MLSGNELAKTMVPFFIAVLMGVAALTLLAGWGVCALVRWVF